MATQDNAQAPLFYVHTARHTRADHSYAGSQESPAMGEAAAYALRETLASESQAFPGDYTETHSVRPVLCWGWGEGCLSTASVQGAYGDACAACLPLALEAAQAQLEWVQAQVITDSETGTPALGWAGQEEFESARPFVSALFSPEGEPLNPHYGEPFGVPTSDPVRALTESMLPMAPVRAREFPEVPNLSAYVAGTIIYDWILDAVYGGQWERQLMPETAYQAPYARTGN